MNKTKVISILLSVGVIASLMSGCKKADPAATQQTPQNNGPVTIKLFDAAGSSLNFQGDDPIWQNNPVAKDIQKKLNITIQMDIPTGNGNDKLNLLLASGDYPEVILSAGQDQINKMITGKIAIPLDSLIEKDGPNIKKAYGDLLNKIKADDGHNYYLTKDYGQIQDGVNPPGYGSTFSIRKDAYEGIGSPAIKTTDDIYNVLKQLAQKYPTNEAGQKVWPISGFKQTWQNTMQTLLDGAGAYDSKWYINDGKLQYWVRAPWALTVVKFYNKLQREGLLDPESFVMDMGTWSKTKLATARTLSHIGNWWMNWTVENDYKAAGMKNAENMSFVDLAFSVPGGQKPNLVPVNTVGVPSTIITKNCKDPDSVMKLLNYLASPEGNFMVENGVQGGMWDMQNGKPAMKPEFATRWNNNESDEKFAAETGNRLYRDFVSTGTGRSPWGTYWILKDDPVAMNNPKAQKRDDNLGKYWYNATPVYGLFVGAPDDINNISSLVDDRFNNQFYTAILAKSEAECEAEFNKYVKGLDDAGLAKYEQYANQAYQKNLKK